MSGDRLTVTIQLPQNFDYIIELLQVIQRQWPEATLDTNNPGGWNIIVPPAP